MQASDDVTQALLRFYELRTAADAATYDEIVSADQLVMVGTAPDEWFEDREQLRGHFANPGLKIERGDVRGFAEGDVGWAVDTPTLMMGDVRLSTRLTAVFHHENGAWKVAHLHFSVAVPDDQAVALQR